MQLHKGADRIDALGRCGLARPVGAVSVTLAAFLYEISRKGTNLFDRFANPIDRFTHIPLNSARAGTPDRGREYTDILDSGAAIRHTDFARIMHITTKLLQQPGVVMKFDWPQYLPLAFIVVIILGLMAVGLTYS